MSPDHQKTNGAVSGNDPQFTAFFNVMPLAKSHVFVGGQTVPAVVTASPKISVTKTTEQVTQPDMLGENQGNLPGDFAGRGMSTGAAKQVLDLPQIKKYVPPAKAAFSGILNQDRSQSRERVKQKIRNVLKFLIGIAAVTIVGLAVWYTANSFGGSLGLPSLGKWIRSLPIINRAKPNTSNADSPSLPSSDSGKESDGSGDGVGQTFITSEEWRLKFFLDGSCATGGDCEDGADPDKDGLNNEAEFKQGTDPKNPDTDQDGLADGDEINIFGCSPLDAKTARNPDYSDADDVVGGWRCYRKAGEEEYYNVEELKKISENAKGKGFHEPTLTTLGADAEWYLNWSQPQSMVQGASIPEGFEVDDEAKLNRDIQRLNTIKQVGVGLIKYRQELGGYPNTNSFSVVVSTIRPYLGVATNSFDPINVPPFEYHYELKDEGETFVLSYFSETQKQKIVYTSASAQKDFFTDLAISRDEQRMYDLDKLRSALLIVSAAEGDVRDGFMFPSQDLLESKVTPEYLPAMPKDPITEKPYEYQVSKDKTSFTLKAILEKAPSGLTGYLCNQEECRMY